MIVRIELRREDGTVLVIMEGAANAPLEWQAPIQADLIDLPGRYALAGFLYRPVTKKLPSAVKKKEKPRARNS